MNEDQLYLEVTNAVDLKEWGNAKSLITKVVKSGDHKLAKKVNDYYQHYVCKYCGGSEVVSEGEFDNQEEVKCHCQL